MNIGWANDMDTFGKRISPQVTQEIQISAYCGRKLRSRIRLSRVEMIAHRVGPLWPKVARDVGSMPRFALELINAIRLDRVP